MAHIGEVIRSLRKKANMTQEQLAQNICSRIYISQIEKGLVSPSPQLLEKIAQRLNITVEELESMKSGSKYEYIQKKLEMVIEEVENGNLNDVESVVLELANEKLEEKELAAYIWVRGNYEENILHDYKAAMDSYASAIELSENNDLLMHIRSLVSLGYMYGKNGNDTDPLQGFPYLKRAYELCQMNNVTGNIRISVLLNYGLLFFKTGNCAKAIEMYFQAVELNEAYRTDYRLEHAYIGLSIAYADLQQYHEAKYYCLKVIELYEKKNLDDTLLVATYSNLGIIYRKLNDYEASANILQKSLSLAKKTGSDYHIRNTQIELSLTYKSMKRLLDARELCIDVIRNGKSVETVAEAKYVLAEIMLEINEETQAIELLEEALPGFKKKRLTLYHLPKTYYLLGQLYKQTGNLTKALEMFEESAKIQLQNKGHISQ